MKKSILSVVSCLLLLNVVNAGGYIDNNIESIDPVISPLVQTQSNKDSIFKNYYLGLGLSLDRVATHNYSKESVYSVVTKAGYSFNSNFDVELRASLGLNRGDYLKHDYSYGIFFKPKYNYGDFSIYGLIGYSTSKLSLSSSYAKSKGVKSSTKQDGFSYGIGVEYKQNSKTKYFLDVVQLVDKSTQKLSGRYKIDTTSISAGAVYSF